ncbi:MAG: dephospho-CoA kinase [Candidatus Edwardsbacteria bacterium]
MLIIGLTGGIASGKSTVADFFEKWGAKIIKADEIGHQLILPSKKAWREIVETFGEGILLPHGPIDRLTLSKIVFANPTAKKKLNAIVHPLLIKEIERELQSLKEKIFEGVVVIDAALIVEWGIQKTLCQKLITVETTRKNQIKRLMENKGLTLKEAEQRIDSQLERDERIEAADYVIKNDGSIEELEKRAKKIWGKIKAT